MANPNPNQDGLQKVTPGKVARELGRKGGIASGIAKRKKRTMKEDAEWLLSLLTSSGEQIDEEQIVEYAQLQGKNITASQAMLTRALNIALNPDSDPKDVMKAIELLRDTSGQKPTDSISMNASVSNPLAGMTTEELRAMANLEEPKPKRKRGRPKKVKTDD